MSEDPQYIFHEMSDEPQYNFYAISDEPQNNFYSISDEPQNNFYAISDEPQYDFHAVSVEPQYIFHAMSEEPRYNLRPPPAPEGCCKMCWAPIVTPEDEGFELPEINFSIVDFDGFPCFCSFWGRLGSWFRERGYIIHESKPRRVSTSPQLPSYIPKLPYSYYDAEECSPSYPPCSVSYSGDKILYAQDSQTREVAIKIVSRDSDGYAIYNMLRGSREAFDDDDFCGVLPPVDMLDYDEQHVFVIMPRWGRNPFKPWFTTNQEVIQMMTWMLKGLTFLHEQSIVHRDISPTNVLINHYSADQLSSESNARRMWRLESADRVKYSWIDFDCAMLLPKSTRRLPSSYAYVGKPMWHPNDICAGEHDYDPYAYDVACLGNVFADYFDGLVPQVPLLAPLLDKMTTWDVASRFSARQALEFMQNIDASLTEEQRKGVPTELCGSLRRTIGARWVGLPVEFTKTWSSYAAKEPSLVTRLLWRICRSYRAYRVISWLRRILRV